MLVLRPPRATLVLGERGASARQRAPIRPDEVIEMNNFYTVTVYDKGAEVIRMLHTLLTEEGFRRGMDLYFVRHDVQAVTCDDFVDAMQDANNVNLYHSKLLNHL